MSLQQSGVSYSVAFRYLPLRQTSAVFAQGAAAPTDDSEIVVTAAKREQSVRDVSGSVSAVSEATLQKLNAQSLSDYIARVPGVVFNDYQPGISEVVIRGIASSTYHEANQSTTGYYLNELPLGEPGFPLVIPDVDSFDVARVEVLRGPQGTLFGSSSLGGAVNYIFNRPIPAVSMWGSRAPRRPQSAPANSAMPSKAWSMPHLLPTSWRYAWSLCSASMRDS
jgi:outer membrane receptor protein involved in Fe transport